VAQRNNRQDADYAERLDAGFGMIDGDHDEYEEVAAELEAAGIHIVRCAGEEIDDEDLATIFIKHAEEASLAEALENADDGPSSCAAA
jgi:hypothetical protein